MKKHSLLLTLSILAGMLANAQTTGFRWVKSLGANSQTVLVTKVAVNSTGTQVYVAGVFKGGAVDFDPGPGNTNTSSVGNSIDIFVARYTSNGVLSSVITIGNSNSEELTDMTIDANGDVIIVGNFQGSNVDFNPAAGTNNLSSAGDRDMFIAKYSASLSHVWAFSIGNSLDDQINGVATDASSNIYITGSYRKFGSTNAPDFNPGSGTAVPINGFVGDAFVAKYNMNFNFLWVFSITDAGSTNGTQVGKGISIDSNGDILVHGTFSSSTDFDISNGTQILNPSSGTSFIAKYSQTPSLKWASAYFSVSNVKPSANGEAVFTGIAQVSGQNALHKISSLGSIVWTSAVTVDNNKHALTVDPASNIYLYNGVDSRLVKYQSNGSLMWSFPFTGNAILHADNQANLYAFSGPASGTKDFDPGIDNTQTTAWYNLVKYGQCFPAPAPTVTGNTSICSGSSATLSVSDPQLFESQNWRWYSGPCGGTLVGTGPTVTITPTIPGTYSVRAEGGCYDPAQCTSFFVSIASSVTPTVTVSPWSSPDDNVCIGDSLEYRASGLYGGTSPVYQWKVNNLNVGGNSERYKGVFNNGDKIKCQITSNATCVTQTTVTSNERTVTVNAFPSPAPNITRVGDTLFSNYQTGNQWYLEATLIPGETNPYHVMDLSDNIFPKLYSVIVTASNGCRKQKKINITSAIATDVLKIADDFEFFVYPNPVSDVLKIETSGLKSFQYQLFNLSGQTLHIGQSVESVEILPMYDVPSGIYVLQLTGNETTKSIRIVKQ